MSITPYPVKFSPVAQERIWGGSKLKECFHVHSEKPIGEYWVLSGHPNGTSVVVNGELAGQTLTELIEEYPQAYLGHSPQNRFPLLIKFLEASDDLSVQIHPDDPYAQEREGDFGKTEAWYILDCCEDTKVIYDHSFKSKEEYLATVKEKRVSDYLCYQAIEKDQLVFVPSQTLHALLAGTILIEIQQTSDVTYRVYDWDRVDAEGNSRELHIDKASDVMTYDKIQSFKGSDSKPQKLVETDCVQHEHLVTCPYFVIEKVTVKEDSYRMIPGWEGNPDILIVAEGEGVLHSGEGFEPIKLRQGDAILIPSSIREYEVRSLNEIKLLRTYY
jgi:mannose-6-phosphate isomerase